MTYFLQYVGCTLIVSHTLKIEKAVELAQKIVKKGPKSNKRRVTLIFTPEEVFVNDTIYRVSHNSMYTMHNTTLSLCIYTLSVKV